MFVFSQRLCAEGHSCTTQTRWVDHPPTRDFVLVKVPVEKHRTGTDFQSY